MLNIVLSGTARNAVRALVRKHADFDSFCERQGVDASRNMTKGQLMMAVELFGLEAQARELAAKHGGSEGEDMESDMPETSKPAMPAMPADMDTDAMRESVLRPLRGFCADVILKGVETALEPILQAASKPAVEIERIVTIDSNGNFVQPAGPIAAPAAIARQATIGGAFGIKGKLAGATVNIWNATDAPPIDPYYVCDPSLITDFVTAMERGHYVWCGGPAGSGKTTLPAQVAARTGRPFYRIAMDRAVEPTDLFGMQGLDGKGGMAWIDGKLIKAIRRPGTIIQIDEITATPPGIAMVLQTSLDEKYINLASGERVDFAPGVYFCAGDNTFGYGDDTGMYHGTNQANQALVDRFARMIKVDYLAPDLESIALANRTGAKKEACEIMVNFVGGARKLPGFDSRPMSLRRMIAFMGMMLDGFDAMRAFEDTFLTRLPDAEREALRGHIKASFPSGAFDAAMKGNKPQAPAAPQSVDPAQVKARNAFTAID